MALATHQVQGSYAPPSLSRKKGIKFTQNLTASCTFPRTGFNLYVNRVEPPLIHGSNRKILRISSFKGSDEHRDRMRGSRWVKNSVKRSYFSSNGVLTSLPTASPNQDLRLKVPSSNEKCGILKTVWNIFLSLDAKIKIPAIIFIPLFLVVNIIYGAHVAKELTPLWIAGPLLVALYMKMLHVIYSLYVFSYQQSVKVVNNFTRGEE